MRRKEPLASRIMNSTTSLAASPWRRGEAVPAPLPSGGTALVGGVSVHGCPSPSPGSARARLAPWMAADSDTCSQGPCKFNQIRNSLSERRRLESVMVIVLVPAVPRPRLATLFLESRGGTTARARQRRAPKAPPGPSGEQVERSEGPGGTEGAGRGPGEAKSGLCKSRRPDGSGEGRAAAAEGVYGGG